MSRIEEYPIDEKLVEQFVEKNKSQWQGEPLVTKDKIYLNFSMVRMQTTWITSKLLFAKGVSDKLGKQVVVLTWRNNPLLTKYIESFGFTHISLDDLSSKNPLALYKSIFKLLGVLVSKNLIDMKMCGVRLGNCFYEDILRTSSMSTIRSLWNKVCIKKLLHLIWVSYALDDFLKKNPPVVAICDDVAYHEGAFNKLFNKYGAKLYATNNVVQRKVQFDEKKEIIRRPKFNQERYAKVIDKVDSNKAAVWFDDYIEKRFQGKNGRNIDRGAFAGKKVLSREEILSQFGLNSGKKNVVIMAHTFTDAIYNYGHDYYFRDYYDWAEKTLMIASEVSDVNWILKPHPTRSAYNESIDSIEKMFDRYKKANMRILSDDISAETIKNIADVMITIGGNAGAEFSCFGVPTIIVGKPYYSGFGYTIEPATYDEYEKTLKNVSTIEPLNDNQIIMAKNVFYLNEHIDEYDKSSHSYKDELANILNEVYTRMQDELPLQYFKDNSGTKKYNDETLKCLCEYISNHKLNECDYYLNGFKAE